MTTMSGEQPSVSEVLSELKEVRRRGYLKLDASPTRPNRVDTPLLEAAATRVPGYRPNMIRSSMIELLLKHEINQIGGQHGDMLTAIFGVKRGLDASKADQLRANAAKSSGQKVAAFKRDTEFTALSALAEQIVVDYKSVVVEKTSTLLDNEPISPELITNSAHESVSETAELNSESESIATRTRGLRLRIALATAAVLIATATTYIVVNRSQSDTPSADTDPPPIGDSLRITRLNWGDSSYGNSVVFDSAHKDVADRFVNRIASSNSPSSSERLVANAVEAGAYVYGGLKIGITVESQVDEEVAIYDIEVHKQAQPIATDTAIIEYSGGPGGAVAQIDFDLDKSNPIPKDTNRDPNAPPRSFFDSSMPSLSRGQKQTFVLTFDTQLSAYTFEFDVRYEISGHQYRQIGNYDGKPFRVSARLCPDKLAQADIPDDDKQRLRALQYRTVIELGSSKVDATTKYAANCGWR